MRAVAINQPLCGVGHESEGVEKERDIFEPKSTQGGSRETAVLGDGIHQRPERRLPRLRLCMQEVRACLSCNVWVES